MKRLLILVCMFVLVIPTGLIMAEEAAPENEINIYLQLGEDEITINGETITIVKPYVVNGTTLVPLRVITEAFGAELTWISATQTVILEYGDKIIELSIGSKEAYVNETVQELLVEPALVSSTTMVPLRFISENFGAEVEYVDATREIFITGTLLETAADRFNEDEGKTHIGDSHFGWTMNYPTGMAIFYQNFDGSTVILEDINGEYDIYIYVEDRNNLSQADVLREISSYNHGTLLDRRNVIEDDRTYARTLSKNNSGVYTEMRGYLQGDKVYCFILKVLNEADYLNEDKIKNYEDLVNSFVLTYDSKSQETKDIANVKDGFIQYSNDDYGLTLKIPEGWTETWYYDISFSSENYDRGFMLDMTSKEEGDTIAAWIKRDDDMMRELYADGFIQFGEQEQLTISGQPAIVRHISFRVGSNWHSYYDVYFFIDDYKINVAVNYLSDDYDAMKSTIQTIMESISIDEEILNKSFGYIEDDTEYDMSKLKTFRNNDFKYSITYPEYWSEYEDHDGYEFVSYGINGSYFSLYATKDLSYADMINSMDYLINLKDQFSSEFKLVSKTVEVMNGLIAQKYVYREVDFIGHAYETVTYIMQKNNIVYLLEYIMMDASTTPTVLKQMKDVIDSFTID